MTGEHERYPPPNFSGEAEPHSSSRPPQSRRFEASRDWSWTQPAPAGPWSFRPGQSNCQSRQHTGHHHHHHHHYHEGWRGSAQQHWGRKQKQQREPEFSHFCDTCDRGFKTQDKYEEHISQHVQCSVEDCRFTAHEKLVKIHWRNNHAPGVKRIKLDTAEDIARWREERRRNYPTLRNVEKKLKLMEVKEQRGDVLETPQFGRIRSHGRGRGSNPMSTDTNALKPERQDRDPLAALADSEPESDKDESVQWPQTGLTVAPKSVTSALGSLMSSYGDEMSDSEGDTDDAPVLRATVALEENKMLLMAHPLPVQRITTPHEKRTDRPQQSHHAPASRGRGGGRGAGRGARGAHRKPAEPLRQPPTLLEMLLAPDIRHERNVVLQCVRFIIRNGFFGLAGKNCNEIQVSVNTSGDKGGSDPQISQSQESIRGASPSGARVFQQLFAEHPVCDESEPFL